VNWEDRAKLLGDHFGFPDCCIVEFSSGDTRCPPLVRQFHGTGYVPCKLCNLLSKEELLKNIESKRKHPLPFPEDDFDIAFKVLNLED
jgi:hypothetical protein